MSRTGGLLSNVWWYLRHDDLDGLKVWSRNNSLHKPDPSVEEPVLDYAVRYRAVISLPWLLGQGLRPHDPPGQPTLVEALLTDLLQNPEACPRLMATTAIEALLDAGSPFRYCPGWAAATLGLVGQPYHEVAWPGYAWTLLDHVMTHPTGWTPERADVQKVWLEWVAIIEQSRRPEATIIPFEIQWLQGDHGRAWLHGMFKAIPWTQMQETTALLAIWRQSGYQTALMDTVEQVGVQSELVKSLRQVVDVEHLEEGEGRRRL